MDARIWLSGSEGEPRSVALEGERTVVGRDPEADIHLDDEAVSWNHLEIAIRGGVLMATDLDSRNGTMLNGDPLDKPRRLRDGDTLLVGGRRLELSDPIPGRAGATVAAAGALGRPHRRGARDRRGPRRPVPHRGRLRRPPGDPGRDRRGPARQRAHRPAPPRRARHQARRPRRRGPRAPPPDRRPRDRARPRPQPLRASAAPAVGESCVFLLCERKRRSRGSDRAKAVPMRGGGGILALGLGADHRWHCKYH